MHEKNRPNKWPHTAHELSNPIRTKSRDFPSPSLLLARAGMATLARWLPPPAPRAAGPAASAARPLARRRIPRRAATVVSPRAFGRADFDGFVRRAWRGANAGAERLAFEARQAAQRLEGRFSISRRLAEASRAARARAVEIDAELGIGRRWRSFSVDFSRNWPRVRILCGPLAISNCVITSSRSNPWLIWFLMCSIGGSSMTSWQLPSGEL